MNPTIKILALATFLVLDFQPTKVEIWRVEENYQYVRQVESIPQYEYNRTTAEVSAYTLGRVEETDDSPCIGAFGDNLCEMVSRGIGVCASNAYGAGQRLVVGGFECRVLDRMNARYDNGEIDIAMLDYQQAKQYGRKQVDIKIIKD